MNNHTDIFLYLTLIREQYELSIKSMIPAVMKMTGLSLDEKDIQLVLDDPHKPDTGQLARAMREKGYSPGFIGDYLKIKASTVSYHLGKGEHAIKPYVNPTLYALDKYRYAHNTHVFAE